MTQNELDREVARATGETVMTISQLGFVPLKPIAYESEQDREPLVIDWDERDQQRQFILP